MKKNKRSKTSTKKGKNRKCSRRDLIKKGAVITGLGLLGWPVLHSHLFSARTWAEKEPKPDPAPPDGEAGKTRASKEAEKLARSIAVIDGNDPAKMTALALETLGGLKRFIKKGDVVVVKPNIAWERTPEFAVTTNPEVVATIVQECLKVGAKKVKVFDRTCNEARRAYRASGIEAAAKAAGADVLYIKNRESFYTTMELPKRKEKWPIVKEALECDFFINVPIAKHHSLTKLTLGIKNLMGVMGGRRGTIHREIDSYLTDMLRIIPPHLTVIDAYRVLTAHGPTGGNLTDVKMAKKIIAGFDPVAVDAYAATLPEFGLEPADINYIYTAAEEKLGEMDLSKMNIIKKTI